MSDQQIERGNQKPVKTLRHEWETFFNSVWVSRCYRMAKKRGSGVNVSIANGEDMYADLKDSKFKKFDSQWERNFLY